MGFSKDILSVVDKELLQNIYVPGFLDEDKHGGFMCFVPDPTTVYLEFETVLLMLKSVEQYDKLAVNITQDIEYDSSYEAIDAEFHIGMLTSILLDAGGQRVDALTAYFDNICSPEQGIVRGMELVFDYGYLFFDPINTDGIRIYKCREERNAWIRWLGNITEVQSSSWQRP
jgi:hypothetical protein